MVIFHCYVSSPEGIWLMKEFCPIPLGTMTDISTIDWVRINRTECMSDKMECQDICHNECQTIYQIQCQNLCPIKCQLVKFSSETLSVPKLLFVGSRNVKEHTNPSVIKSQVNGLIYVTLW